MLMGLFSPLLHVSNKACMRTSNQLTMCMPRGVMDNVPTWWILIITDQLKYPSTPIILQTVGRSQLVENIITLPTVSNTPLTILNPQQDKGWISLTIWISRYVLRFWPTCSASPEMWTDGNSLGSLNWIHHCNSLQHFTHRMYRKWNYIYHEAGWMLLIYKSIFHCLLLSFVLRKRINMLPKKK